MTDAHMVNGDISCAVTTNAAINSFATFDNWVHMVAHIMRNNRRFVFALIGTVGIRTVVHNNFVMIGNVVIEVCSCCETFVTLGAFVGIDDAS